MKAQPQLVALLFPLALVAAAAWLIREWTLSRKAAADPNAAPPEAAPPVVLSDIGAKIIAEDSTDEVVKALIEHSQKTNTGVAYDSGDVSLFLRTNRYMYPDEVPPIWGSRTTAGTKAPNVQ